MNLNKGNIAGLARFGQLCSAAGDVRGISINGEMFVPDAATAYAEIFISHAFPVYLDVPNPGETPDRTALHPQTVANSFRSLRAKPVNFAHLMRSYDPKKIVRDRIYGCVMAVEFPSAPAEGWKVQCDPALAPAIRAVVALHKNAEGVPLLLETWAEGKTPFTDTVWTVSMEKESYLDDGGFLVKAEIGEWSASTPEDFKALGWSYMPYNAAPDDLKACLKPGGHLGIQCDYKGFETLFLDGGLGGSVFYYGMAFTPIGKESAAYVARVEASRKFFMHGEDAAAQVAGIMDDFLNRLAGLQHPKVAP